MRRPVPRNLRYFYVLRLSDDVSRRTGEGGKEEADKRSWRRRQVRISQSVDTGAGDEGHVDGGR